MSGGPSEGKLEHGDRILSINGEDVEEAPREHVIKLVRLVCPFLFSSLHTLHVVGPALRRQQCLFSHDTNFSSCNLRVISVYYKTSSIFCRIREHESV